MPAVANKNGCFLYITIKVEYITDFKFHDLQRLLVVFEKVSNKVYFVSYVQTNSHHKSINDTSEENKSFEIK